MEQTPALPNESRLELPAFWRLEEPEHASEDPEPEAPQRLRELLAEHRELLETALALPKNASYVGAVRSYLDGEPDPLGAAAAAAVVDNCTEESVLPHLAVDAWLVEYGLGFAAAAMTVGGGLFIASRAATTGGVRAWTHPPLLWRGFTRNYLSTAFDDTAKLRAAIESCDATRYERVRAAVAEHRTSAINRGYAAFMFPREHDWVLETCAEHGESHAATGVVWPIIGTAEQLSALPATALAPAYVGPRLLGTLMANLGGDSLPALTATAEQPSLDPQRRRTALTAVAMLPTDAAMTWLLDRSDRTLEFEAACDAARRFPVRTLRLAAARTAAEADERRRLAAIVECVGPEALEAATARLEPSDHERVRCLLERPGTVPSADPESLPRLLVRPPWGQEREHGARRALNGLEPDRETVVEWLPGEREQWAGNHADRYRDLTEDRWAEMADHPRLAARVAAFGPEPLARAALARLKTSTGTDFADLGGALLRFGEEAVEGVVARARSVRELNRVLLPIVNLDVARLMAERHARVKSARALAVSWFDRHHARAARLLVPDALGKSSNRRDYAQAALLLIIDGHGAEIVEAAARSYGPEALEAVRPIVEADPLRPLGGVVPSHPDWAAPTLLPQVLLKGGERALPDAAVRHLTAALSVCVPEYEYPGVDVIAECCDRRSLAEFSLALFERWTAFGTPPDGVWALTQLAYFADEDTITTLASHIRPWPGQNRHHLAVAGLNVLRAIGTESALRAIHRIASRTKFKGLRRRAGELVDEIAADLGLTGERLADRLVPDFGLGEEAALVLDYGPRQFKVGFDEQLKPFVTDMDGKARKTLPKPGKRDDGKTAEASRKRFSQLKKELRAVAGDQVRRLEKAMIDSRTWSTEEFQRYFAKHPLMRHLARRLVWTAETGGGTVSFRVDEASALADASDEPLDLPDDAVIRLAHCHFLKAEEIETWAGVLSDYEILQPFEQLSRPIHVLTEEERRTGRLTRFEGARVVTGRLLGLEKHGWERSAPLDNGIQAGLSYALPGGGHLNIELDRGIGIGFPDVGQDDVLEAVYFAPRRLDWFGHHRNATPPEDLDPVTASELLWTLSKLTGTA